MTFFTRKGSLMYGAFLLPCLMSPLFPRERELRPDFLPRTVERWRTADIRPGDPPSGIALRSKTASTSVTRLSRWGGLLQDRYQQIGKGKWVARQHTGEGNIRDAFTGSTARPLLLPNPIQRR